MLRLLMLISMALCLLAPSASMASTIFTSLAQFNNFASGSGHTPILYDFTGETIGLIPSGVVPPLINGLDIAFSTPDTAAIDNAGGFGGSTHFDAAISGTDLVTIILPTHVKGWGADFLDWDIAASTDLHVKTLLDGIEISSYSFSTILGTSGGSPTFLGSREGMTFNQIQFAIVGSAGFGENLQMDNLRTYVPEPASSTVFAMNFVLVGALARRWRR